MEPDMYIVIPRPSCANLNEIVMKKRIELLPRMIYLEINFLFFFLSWILKSRKYVKAEEEHLTSPTFGPLSLPFPCCPQA